MSHIAIVGPNALFNVGCRGGAAKWSARRQSMLCEHKPSRSDHNCENRGVSSTPGGAAPYPGHYVE